MRKLNAKFNHAVNECYLFHGTNPDAADKIARDKLRISKANHGMFGRGLYLAECASKSDEYAAEGTGVFQGQFAMLLCKTVLGKVCTEKQPGDYEGRVLGGGYDSVCGDRAAAVGTYREFILFEEAAVCAEYIVLYRRVQEES